MAADDVRQGLGQRLAKARRCTITTAQPLRALVDRLQRRRGYSTSEVFDGLVAALTPVHWDAITPRMRELLGALSGTHFMSHFYLAGGTAVALRLGHRRSIDLDFFTGTIEIDRALRSEIIAAFESHDAEAVEAVEGNLVLRLPDGLHVAYLSYGYPLLEDTDDVEGVAIASLADVGLMKLDAVIGRGSRKDFIDLRCIARHHPLEVLLRMSGSKYSFTRDFDLMALEGIVRFDNADRDRQPEMLIDLAWEDVRAFFVAEARRIGRDWFEDLEED